MNLLRPTLLFAAAVLLFVSCGNPKKVETTNIRNGTLLIRAVMLYAEDHGGAYPAKLADVVMPGNLTQEEFDAMGYVVRKLGR